MTAITLANSIIGVGILAMPFCFQQCGVLLSIVLLSISGLMSRLASHFLLKSAIKTRRRNFEILAFYVFGNPGKFVVEIGIIGFLMGTCIAYFVVVGDLGPQIIAKMFNINQSNILRTAVMIIVSLVCVLPLGLLKDVDSLSNVCAVTIGFYFCLVLKVMAEAEIHIFEGDWISKIEYWQPAGVLRCLPIFSMSLFCQTQIFEIYETLPNASLENMNHVTKNAVSICSMVYILVGLFGYIAFCDEVISGNILTNFSPTLASDVIKMGFVMSLACSFPLIIFPCRASLYSLLYRKGHVSPHDILSNLMPDFRFKCLTIGIIGVSLIISLMLPNIELVLGFIGSTIGVIICVIFPATCFIYITIKNTNERMLAQVVLGLGIIIMVLGTYANLQAAEIDSINLKHKYDYVSSDTQMMKKNLQPLDDIKSDTDENENQKKIIKNIEITNDNFNSRNSIEKDKTKFKNNLDNISKDNKNAKSNLPSTVKNEEVRIDKPRDHISPEENQIKLTIEKTKNDIKLENIEKEKVLEEQKKKDLIETIKRHEEEQREIMNEQIEILKEMKKTKKEIENDSIKKKAQILNQTTIEDRKKAVENIQKLAKMAIESLGGKVEVSENIKNHATDQIPAKKINMTKLDQSNVNSLNMNRKITLDNVNKYMPLNNQSSNVKMDASKPILNQYKNIKIDAPQLTYNQSKYLKSVDKAPVPLVSVPKDPVINEGKRDIKLNGKISKPDESHTTPKVKNSSNQGRDGNLLK